MLSVGSLPGRQRGMSYPQLAMLLLIGGAILYTGIRLVPVYMESFSVDTSLQGAREAAKSDPDAPTPGRLRTLVQRRLEVNQAYDMADDLEVYEERNALVMEIAYERRVPWVANIDLVVKFNKQAKVKRR